MLTQKNDTLLTDSVPRVVLQPRKALPFFSRHPWVFRGAVSRITGDPAAGDIVRLHAHDGVFIAWGLFNPNSNICVRLYSWDESIPLTDEFWRTRIDEAIGLRKVLFPSPDSSSACRLIFSEADGLSGLTVDRYGDWLLVQLTSRALAQRQEVLLTRLREALNPKGIWLRTEKGIRAAEGLELADGLLWGEAPPRPLFIEEHGVRYGIDVAEGQKTGFFLDQRDNRRRIADFVKGHRVLDVCCYTGGFSLNCLVNGGAAEVVAVDASEAALTQARANAELNGVGDCLQTVKQDAFKLLEEFEERGEVFDTIILDPPKLARNRQGIEAALRGYYSLNRFAMGLIRPGGFFVTCSCSGQVTHEMFADMLGQAALHANRRLQLIEVRGAAADHPASIHCLETDYLKCYLGRVL
ncbi:class I SAM-dependent rRNA methyltransferase [Schlesneria paludicola]|uniref:class I SAM-dependent rRNA methyltransferase n=1 Tax=Schlesneria paludicola TaxID=360056 RepID=UPI00029A7150|nr:class I SAM-dependent rRNA methyltransferase [Schlesneria paludicola]